MDNSINLISGSFSGHFALLPYYGHGMYPKYNHGDLLKIIPIYNHNILLWGESYLIITGFKIESLNIIRNILPHADEQKIILRPIEKENYPDIVISKSEILYLFIIKSKLEINKL